MRREGKILFLLRQNTGHNDGLYALPGGHLEGDESFKEAACRELLEETGIKISQDQLVHRITFHGLDHEDTNRVGVYFEAINWQGEPQNLEPEKHGELAWFDQDNLPETITPHARLKLENIRKNETYIEYGN